MQSNAEVARSISPAIGQSATNSGDPVKTRAKRPPTPDPKSVRTGEMPQFWLRTERIFRSDGGWYIRTREGIDVGPYPCRFDAEVEYESLIARLQVVNPERVMQVVNNYALAACSGEVSLNTVAYTSYLVEEGGAELLKR